MLRAEVEVVQLPEASEHQPGPNQQDNSQRELDDDERRSHPVRASSAVRSPSAFFQDLVDVGARHLQSGRKAEDDPGRETNARHVAEDRWIQLEDDKVWFSVICVIRVDCPYARPCEEQSTIADNY